MKIDRVEAINLLYKYPPPGGFRYAGGMCTGRVTTIILVHTDSGEIGVGSVYSHPALVHLIVEKQLDELLRGKAAGKPVWQLLGGKRPECPAYASGLLWNDIELNFEVVDRYRMPIPSTCP